MTKEQLIELVKFTAGEIVAPTTLNNEDAESIVDDFVDAEQLTIPVVTTRLFFFDCWKCDGILETKEIETTCEEHATLKFQKVFGEDYGFDPPYC